MYIIYYFFGFVKKKMRHFFVKLHKIIGAFLCKIPKNKSVYELRSYLFYARYYMNASVSSVMMEFESSTPSSERVILSETAISPRFSNSAVTAFGSKRSP